jgi:hypothetical protein
VDNSPNNTKLPQIILTLETLIHKELQVTSKIIKYLLLAWYIGIGMIVAHLNRGEEKH